MRETIERYEAIAEDSECSAVRGGDPAAILAVLVQGEVAEFADAMALRLGLGDGRDYLSQLLNRAIRQEMSDLGWHADRSAFLD